MSLVRPCESVTGVATTGRPIRRTGCDTAHHESAKGQSRRTSSKGALQILVMLKPLLVPPDQEEHVYLSRRCRCISFPSVRVDAALRGQDASGSMAGPCQAGKNTHLEYQIDDESADECGVQVRKAGGTQAAGEGSGASVACFSRRGPELTPIGALPLDIGLPVSDSSG